jgi:RimJ/RimL family protein N-acetyltransferase
MTREFLKGERVMLCPFEKEQLAKAQEWINAEEVRCWLANVFPLNGLQEEEWFERVSKSDRELVFAVRLVESEEHVGNCGLHAIDWVNRSAEYGVVLGEPSARCKGYGTEVTSLVLRYAFEQLNLNRVFLRVYGYNLRAVRCYEKAGYRLEGRLRQARYWEGRYWDVFVMSVLRSEYRARQSAGERRAFGKIQGQE